MKISECMCPDVCYVHPNCNVYDVARIMNENHVGCIPVCNTEKNVVGLITDRDIVLRSVACNKDNKTTPVSEIMTTNVYTCKCGEDLENAQNIMSKNQVRRIPIVNEENKMVGIISTGDLAHINKNVKDEKFSKTYENICNCNVNSKNNK